MHCNSLNYRVRRDWLRAGTAADRLVKDGKEKPEQVGLVQLKPGDAERAQHFKYLGAMQSSDRDPPVSVKHPLECLKTTKTTSPPPFKCVSHIYSPVQMRVRENVSARKTQAKWHSFKDFINN